MNDWEFIESPHLMSCLFIQESLLLEREAAEEARKALTQAEARNAELIKKFEDSERKVDQLQNTVQRLVKILVSEKNGLYGLCVLIP